MKSKYELIGSNIKEAREAKGLSQKQLADAIDYETPTAISLIESGTRKVAVKELEKIAKYLQRDIKFFLGQEEKIDIRLALRADEDLTSEDQNEIINFVEFVKSRNKPRIRHAREAARKLLREAGITTPPIWLRDVVIHLRKKHDLSVFPWSFGDKVDGIQVTEDGTPSIGYNELKHPHRQRFTVSHEIGHLILGHTRADTAFNLDSKNPQEIEANQFAAELLIPLAMLKADIKNGMNNPEDLIRRYWVSEEAMWWKLRDSNLIKKLSCR